MELLWRSSCWKPCHCQGDDFNDTKKSNKLWPHLYWTPAVKRSLGVSPPKGDIPSVTKHHYCLCFCRQKNILRKLKNRRRSQAFVVHWINLIILYQVRILQYRPNVTRTLEGSFFTVFNLHISACSLSPLFTPTEFFLKGPFRPP